MLGQPELPYAGTSGWSGSDTSEARAREADASGETLDRQQQTLRMLEAMGLYGMTVADVRRETGWHHGQASSVLTVLHKAGRIHRLTETRDRCKVYVLPHYRNNRPTEPMGQSSTTALLDAMAAYLRGGDGDLDDLLARYDARTP